jgi:hypothetical protein
LADARYAGRKFARIGYHAGDLINTARMRFK